jgi:dipeptidyl aminopeptidase/acylaminoacyl peptidase
MTSGRRFEQDLPDLLEQLALGPTPDYRDHIFQQTARMRQRPAWMFPERWLPMSVLTTRAAAPPRVPWRIVGLVALLLVVLAVGTLLIVGSQPRLPAPFGPARNGHIAYSAQGDIFTVDPLSGVATAVVTGPETDLAPIWSRDGTRFAFERKVAGPLGPGRLYVARADGRGLVAVTPEPRERLSNVAFSPDGREIAFTSGPENATELWIADAGGSGIRQLKVGMGVVHPVYRPPNGAEIVFAGQSPVAVGNGLYAVDVKRGAVRTILAPAPGVDRDFASVSPDGSRIAYSAAADDPNRNTFRVHVVAADGSNDVTLPMPAGATFQDAPSWSNDGTRLVVVRGYATRNQDMAIAVLPDDGSRVGVETAHGLTGCCDTANEWAPDDTSILTTPFDLDGQPLPQLLLDPVTLASRPAPWAATSNPAWQRQAP